MFPVKTFYKLRSDHLSVFYGAPGSGKSTIACFYAQKALKAGYKVFSNFPIKGCYMYDKSDLGTYAMQHCLIIVDEAGIDWNNRDFAYNFNRKNGGHKALEFFKKHRHEHAEIMCFSQTFDDMDKKIFDLADRYYIVSKGVLPWPHNIVMRRIKVKPDIDRRTDQPYDKYSFMAFGKKRIFAKPLWKYFDSYDTMGLPEKPEWKIYGEPQPAAAAAAAAAAASFSRESEATSAGRKAAAAEHSHEVRSFDEWTEFVNLPTTDDFLEAPVQ